MPDDVNVETTETVTTNPTEPQKAMGETPSGMSGDDKAEGLEVADEFHKDTPEGKADEGADKEVVSADEPLPGAEGNEEYAPTMKYKASGEEHDFPDWVKTLVTTPELEEQFREIFSKGHGIEAIKAKGLEWEKNFNDLHPRYLELDQKYQAHQDVVGELRQHLNDGDFESFRKTLNIPPDLVYKWALHQIQLQEMPPEQRQWYNDRVKFKGEAASLKRENEGLKARQDEAEVQTLYNDLNTELEKPEINSVMQDFDRRRGEVGAFRKEVAMRAAAIHNVTGKDPSPSEAIASLLTIMGHVHAPNAGVGTQAGTGTPSSVAKPPVIPKIQGRSLSPTKQAPKSIEDIRARYEQM